MRKFSNSHALSVCVQAHGTDRERCDGWVLLSWRKAAEAKKEGSRARAHAGSRSQCHQGVCGKEPAGEPACLQQAATTKPGVV